MIWDSCLIRGTAAELNDALGGARARSFRFLRDERRVVVYFREATLLVDLSGGAGWMTLEGAAEAPDGAEPLPAVLVAAEAPLDERTMELRFRRVRGRKPNPSLILELATNRWNALWVEGGEKKVVKRLRSDLRRPHAIGQPWAFPGGAGREGAGGDLEDERLAALLREAESGGRGAILGRLAHVSSINVEALSEGAGLPERAARWRRMARMEELHPCLLHLETGQQPYPWPLPGLESTAVGTILEAMALAAASSASRDTGADVVEAHLRRKARHLERRARSIRTELERTAEAPEIRARAHLVLASLHLIPPGVESATVPGLDGLPTTLQLDPGKRPQDQAEELFRQAGRMERAATELPAELDRIQGALDELQELQASLREGTLPEPVLASLREEAETGKGAGAPRGSAPAEPFRRYRSSGGLEIRVGRNSRRNDELTFRHARPNDVWLHARHASGAHVVLRWTSPDRPPARDLEEAATLAALFSKARGSGHVPVDWTRRKYVRKAKGARPGTVLVERVETIMVSPDPDLPDRLAVD